MRHFLRRGTRTEEAGFFDDIATASDRLEPASADLAGCIVLRDDGG